FLFFFSSRRRHTISKRDWSSDVCSSDLIFIDIPRRFRFIFNDRRITFSFQLLYSCLLSSFDYFCVVPPVNLESPDTQHLNYSFCIIALLVISFFATATSFVLIHFLFISVFV